MRLQVMSFIALCVFFAGIVKATPINTYLMNHGGDWTISYPGVPSVPTNAPAVLLVSGISPDDPEDGAGASYAVNTFGKALDLFSSIIQPFEDGYEKVDWADSLNLSEVHVAVHIACGIDWAGELENTVEAVSASPTETYQAAVVIPSGPITGMTTAQAQDFLWSGNCTWVFPYLSPLSNCVHP